MEFYTVLLEGSDYTANIEGVHKYSKSMRDKCVELTATVDGHKLESSADIDLSVVCRWHHHKARAEGDHRCSKQHMGSDGENGGGDGGN